MTPLTLDRLFELAPLAFLAGFALSLLLHDERRAWRGATGACLAAVILALVAFVAGAGGRLLNGTPADVVGETMMMLVALLGWIITDYSSRYLAGDPGQRRYIAGLMLTLASVSTVAMARNLGLLAVAWAASSLCLHRLLVFYPERAAARIAAHKKFLSSRIAEICLLIAVGIVYQQCRSLIPSDIAAQATQAGGLSVSMQLAWVLVALAVVLKSAQLPVHGWLIQVMEAPTPVSALLHAGIVNLGGFVLIRLAEPLAHAGFARGLLVFFGATTALLAGLVTMTRISIKVRLAWSTCAQMGFMLMECGLGLYDLAMLHLVAHSLYKAHAFLSGGDAVVEARYRMVLARAGQGRASGGVLPLLVPVPICAALILGSLRLWQSFLPALDVNAVALFIVCLGLSPLLWPTGAASTAGTFKALALTTGLTQLYLAWHWAFSTLVPAGLPAESLLPSLWAALCLGALYVAQCWLQRYPTGAFSRRLYPWAYGGFFLDERFTRLTFRLWPAPRPTEAPQPIPQSLALPASGDRS